MKNNIVCLTYLKNAIIVQAARDYKTSAIILKNDPENNVARKEYNNLKRFFCGEWIKMLTRYDGERLMHKIEDEFITGNKQRISGCRGIQKKKAKKNVYF